MEDEVIAYLARKVYELEIQLKTTQSDFHHYYHLAKKYNLDALEEAACQTTDSN